MSKIDLKKVARDLEAEKVTLAGHRNGADSDPVVVYRNKYKGKVYVHIRTLWQDDAGKWMPGKGISLAGTSAKAALAAIGKTASQF
jgi:hypothetical protein